MDKTKRQAKKETRVMERTKGALTRDIREDKKIEEVRRQNFQASNYDLCDRCTAERLKEDRSPRLGWLPPGWRPGSRLGRLGR